MRWSIRSAFRPIKQPSDSIPLQSRAIGTDLHAAPQLKLQETNRTKQTGCEWVWQKLGSVSSCKSHPLSQPAYLWAAVLLHGFITSVDNTEAWTAPMTAACIDLEGRFSGGWGFKSKPSFHITGLMLMVTDCWVPPRGIACKSFADCGRRIVRVHIIEIVWSGRGRSCYWVTWKPHSMQPLLGLIAWNFLSLCHKLTN